MIDQLKTMALIGAGLLAGEWVNNKAMSIGALGAMGPSPTNMSFVPPLVTFGLGYLASRVDGKLTKTIGSGMQANAFLHIIGPYLPAGTDRNFEQ